MSGNDSFIAEQAVLGNVIVYPNESKLALDSLLETDFSDARHGLIFRVLHELYDEYIDAGSKGEFGVDIVLVQERLKSHKALVKVGGSAYIAELTVAASGNERLDEYIKIIKDRALVREFFGVLERYRRRYEEEPIDYSVFLGQAEEDILKITRNRHVSDFVNIQDAIRRTITQLTSSNQSMSSGFAQLDRLIEGFQPGSLVILAARPSVGKTAMALNFALRVAKSGKAVGVFSLEMSTEQIIGRLLTDLSMLSFKKIRRATAPAQRENSEYAGDRLAIANACKALEKYPLYIDDSSAIKLMEIQAKARKLKASCPNLGLIVVDYIGLITSPSRNNAGNRQQEVAEISRGLKALARELSVPVLALSQLSRQVDSRPSHTPVLSDLRESGAIEQDADQVFFLSRPDYYYQNKEGEDGDAPADIPPPTSEEDDDEQISEVNLIIAKNRNGPLGTITFQFNKSHCHFEVMDNYFEGIDEDH